MVVPLEVSQWLDRNFPKPRVDPEWLEGCCDWLIGDQNISPVTAFPEFMNKVKDQLLESDLRDSMLHGTGLDVHIDRFTGNLQGPPVLVQIAAITEIGISAFQLEQIRAAREERLLAGVGDEEGEEDGDIEVEGEGPMPRYPKATLRFQLTDGVTTLEAMEYRRISQFSLGVTPLGYKLQLKSTRIQNGMAFLEPATVTLLGGKQTDLEAQQLDDFKRGLRERLQLPLEPEAEVPQPPAAVHRNNIAPPPLPPMAAVRSPLRDIASPPSPPPFPKHNDDMDMEPRRRRVPPTPALTNVASTSTAVGVSNQTRRISGLPKHHTRTSNGSNHLSEESRTPAAERATLTHVASKQSTNSSYFNSSNSGNSTAVGSGSTARRRDYDINMDVEKFDFNFLPTTRQLSRTFSSPSPFPSPSQPAKVGDDSFDFDLLNDVYPDENLPPPPAQQPPASRDKGKGRVGPSLYSTPIVPQKSSSESADGGPADDESSDDYGMMDDENDFADAEFLKKLDRVEMEALGGSSSKIYSPGNVLQQPPSSGSGSGGYCSTSSSFVYVNRKSTTGDSKDSKKGFIDTSKAPPATSGRVPAVIDIDDSDEDEDMLGADDKENEPVATRHVRRRTVAEDRGLDSGVLGRAFSSQAWPISQSQRTDGRPVVLATNPGDVLDLSDSD
ncbi:hypothetical protein B0H34DRAFT_152469 [Crassisporium funariophilum]|nr:hypothetical protein B0H34DRAFT_152469 [Crassisporium funariophilum]